MQVKDTSIGGTTEILASNDFQAIPIKVTESAAVKAGQPMTLAGKKATVTTGTGGAADTTNAAGILLYDVDPAVNPNGALVVHGIIDGKKAAAHSGATLNVAALKTAVPGIVIRENIGVNE